MEEKCRCGEFHDCIEDYNHHDCLHQCALLLLASDQVICPECGNSWRVEQVEDM